jgi:amino acid adenylation domain-containing protein
MPESLADWVTLQAERRPDAVAVVGDGLALTYAELETRSNRLAAVLRESGCAPGDRVCLLMAKSPLAIVGLLGIYKTGGIYVPLDPSSPAARLEKIVASCVPAFILAAGAVTRLVGELVAGPGTNGAVALGWLDDGPERGADTLPRFTARDVSLARATAPPRGRSRHAPAHILFTSGSTGIPKGVVITHANVIHFVEWATKHFGIGPSDRLSGHPPLQFDLSFFDVFGAFAAGAQLHLVPPAASLLPNVLAEFMRASALTQWFSVPSVLSYMAKFDVVGYDDFPALRRLLWCGEVFATPALIHWMKRLPHVSFTNLYGPTETTIASSHYTLPSCPESERQVIPVGTACDGEEMLVLDEGLDPVPDGQVANLYIRGAGLSPGYWNDPDRTREVFLDGPNVAGRSGRLYRTGDLAWKGEDGQIYFAGRADSQIKSRGYRIELGEIETSLGTLDSIRESAVVAIATGGFEGAMICCAYVPASGAGATPVALRQKLGRLLPVHMLPSRWMAFDRLPRNGNGKIDRASLRQLFETHETVGARQP